MKETDELSVKSQVPIEFRECPPESETVTAYDRQCFRLYITLIDGDASEAEWPETYRKAFGVEIGENWEGAHRQHLAHLKRAQWMMTTGYPQLLRRRTRI